MHPYRSVGKVLFLIALITAVMSVLGMFANAALHGGNDPVRDDVVSTLESTYGVSVVDPSQLSERGSDNKAHDVLLRRDNVTLTCAVYIRAAEPVDAVAFCDGPSKELDRRSK